MLSSVEHSAQKNQLKVAIYGGNGFVGTHVAKELTERNICTVCLSRTGHKPLHLKDQKWSESVRWCKGDASKPDTELLGRVDALVTTVGSPPLPTFSKDAFEQQVFMNGTTNANVIKAAGEAGIRRVILMGAQISWPLRTQKFGYAKGKRIALEAAIHFSETSDQHRAVVLQASAIYGKRHLTNGRVVPLDLFMRPLAVFMQWQFIDVERIAKRIAHELVDDDTDKPALTILRNTEI